MTLVHSPARTRSTFRDRLGFVAAAGLIGILGLQSGAAGTAAAAGGTPSPTPVASAVETPNAAPGASTGNGLVTFGVAPSTASAPDGRSSLSYGVTPRAQQADHVAVLNYSQIPLTLTVYATDAVNTADGGFGLLVAKQQPTDAGRWISLDKPTQTVTVPARTPSAAGMVVLALKVTIPADAEPGDHVAGIVASLQTTGTNKQGARVTNDQRVATRVYIRVAGKLRPELKITRLHATHGGSLGLVPRGDVDVTYTVANTGNIRLAGRQHVSVSNLLGVKQPTKQPDDLAQLLPGNSLVVHVRVPNVVAAGRLTARVSLLPESLPGDSDPGTRVIVATATLWAVPWWLIAVLCALVVAALAYRRIRRRRRPGKDAVGKHRVATKRDPSPAAVR
jgi:hypothetical protein